MLLQFCISFIKYPVLKPQVIIAVLQKFGFSFVSQKGSHAKYSDGTHIVILQMHDKIADGTLKIFLIWLEEI